MLAVSVYVSVYKLYWVSFVRSVITRRVVESMRM